MMDGTYLKVEGCLGAAMVGLLSYYCSNYRDFLSCHRVLVKRLLSQGYKINHLSNTFKKFYGRHIDLVGKYKKNVCQMIDLFFRFVKAKLIKLAGMMGVVHGADHACSCQSTW